MNLDEVSALLAIPYTAEQRAVIGAPPDSPLQIVAGAGSGKTTVMAARVVWLVGNGYVRPEQILGLTFTNKAAASLATKIRTALTALAGNADLDDLEPTISTYHAYAGRLVREHGLRVGVEPDARLLADATRFQLAHRVMRRFQLPLPNLTFVPDTVVHRLVSLESACSDHLVDPRALREREVARAAELDQLALAVPEERGSKGRRDDLVAAARVSRTRAELCELVIAYRAAKRAAGASDFGDQVAAAVRIAEQSQEAVAGEQARFPVVLLDEYQDTSVAQSRLLSALFGDGRGVTAVGDPCQAIYGWRGASVANLDAFARHFPPKIGAEVHRAGLQTSQRSGGRLLTLANRLSADLRGGSVAALESRPDRREVGHVVVARHERYDEERAWIAAQVAGEIASGTPAGEIAILLRAWRHAAPMHQALVDAGVPVEVVGLGGLLTLPEVMDVVSMLSVIDDPAANAALLRLLAGPRWMLGAHDLRALGGYASRLAHGVADEAIDPLEDAASGADPADVVAIGDALDAIARGASIHGLSAEGARRASALQRELTTLRRVAGEPLSDLLARVISMIGLDVESAASPEAVGARRRASLAAFADIAAAYADLDGGAELHGFLSYLRAAEDYDRGFDNPLETSGDAVQILTMHRSKGLEWDVVVLPDLTDKAFPAQNSDGRWHTNMGELPFRERSDAASLPDDPDFAEPGWKKAFETRCKAHELREEDRLAYVAITRARHKVIASNAVWGPTQSTARLVSPYLHALREHAEQGFGTVEVWQPDPPKGARNPYLDVVPTPWPPTLDETSLAARRAVAQQIGLGTGRGDPLLIASEVSAADAARYADFDREIAALLAEARVHRATDVEVALPSALSASQVVRLHENPDGLAVDLARPMPRRPSVLAARGTAFHAWVEGRFELAPLLDDDALTGAADADLNDVDLAALKAAFLASSWADRAPFAVEAGFAVVLGGRVVRGRIDAVYALAERQADGARWHVVDWKTGREDADPLQLAIYRTAWARMRGCADSEVRASFWHVRDDRLTTPALVSAAELERIISM